MQDSLDERSFHDWQLKSHFLPTGAQLTLDHSITTFLTRHHVRPRLGRGQPYWDKFQGATAVVGSAMRLQGTC